MKKRALALLLDDIVEQTKMAAVTAVTNMKTGAKFPSALRMTSSARDCTISS